jgi:hypothetical protein
VLGAIRDKRLLEVLSVAKREITPEGDREENELRLQLVRQVTLPPIQRKNIPPFKMKSSSIAPANTEQNQCLERIRQLEKALEQSFNYLHELKQQLKEQHLLETQLAAAEDFANIQQQAIAKLKQQIAQHYVLQAQLQQIYWELEIERDRSIALERQNTLLQEQILRQEQQAQEYEASVHYWRELALRLQTVVAELAPDLTGDCAELSPEHLALILKSVSERKKQRQVDLPYFLNR